MMNSFNETLYAVDGYNDANYGWSMGFDPETVTFIVGAPFQGKVSFAINQGVTKIS
jgi:KaiC/GvpD/RAD55 family RecA-like ATPase